MAAAGLNNKKAMIHAVIFLNHWRPISVMDADAARGHIPTRTTSSAERIKIIANCTSMPTMAMIASTMIKPGPAAASPAKLPSWLRALAAVPPLAAWPMIHDEKASPADDSKEMVATPAPIVSSVVNIPVAASLAASGFRSMARRPAATSNPRTAAAATYQLRLDCKKPTVPVEEESCGVGMFTHADMRNFSVSPSALENALEIVPKMLPPAAPAAADAALPARQDGAVAMHPATEPMGIRPLPR